MKRLFKIFIISSLFISVTSFALTLRTDEDKLSYTIGNQLGSGFLKNGQSLNPALVMQGVQDGLAGRKPDLSPAEQQQVLITYQKKMMMKAQQKMQAQAGDNQKVGEAFLAANTKKPGVKVTKSGLQYKVIDAGNGAKPKATDTVTVDYEGTLINGKVFDSSYARGKPAQFPVNQVIPGWTEALQMMQTGATWMLYIPANLAYGAQGAPMAGIGPNTVLIFKVHLISIQ